MHTGGHQIHHTLDTCTLLCCTLPGLIVKITAFYASTLLFTICYRLRSEGDNALGSVRLSVRLSVCPFVCALTVEKGNRRHYQFKVFVCVSLISGRMRIIAHMRSIGVLIVSVCGLIILQVIIHVLYV